ncbi:MULTISPECIES: hypothetical protein [Brevibacterium]|uniref:Uncharacterized protein n=1 Tax=Brevibacterium antiquum CNRZ 918 TaxID=1255637 RepID=A0A2H1KJT1_9MICO|nr:MULTISPECIES: hypothetical protein [Brevibacterium]SMX99824.1 hypothetical protein BANT918_02469 [Brevibacterium antiquum CNRZ 918]HCG55993.1 hypothetical protein [Brevibacterium sp.]
MKAAYVNHLGEVDEIRYGDLPDPVPGPTDYLSEVSAASLNHVDALVHSGWFPTSTPLPFVLGRGLVGTVVGAPVGGALLPGQAAWCSSLG